MASIHKRGSAWRVRWLDSSGKHRSQRAPDAATAKQLARKIERAQALGEDWRPRSKAEAPTVEDAAEAYLDDSARTAARGTIEQRRIAIDLFIRCMIMSSRTGHVDLSVFSRQSLADYFTHLTTVRSCSPTTAAQRILVVTRLWEWLYDHDIWGSLVLRPRRIPLPSVKVTKVGTYAPTWAECDRVIAVASTWYPELMTVLRYTGLRAGQALALEWRDVDLDAGLLTIRPALGKSQQERRGRVVPITPHLVETLAGWGRREGFLLRAPASRTPKPQTLARIWARAGLSVPQPLHCFRRAFISELTRRGASAEAIRALVGHSRGVTGDVYTDATALSEAMRAAVALITPIGEGVETTFARGLPKLRAFKG